MKRLLVDVYRLIYLISGAKMFSVVIAVIYVTILNMIVIYGMGMLLSGWMPTGFIQKLFAFPYYFLTGGLMFWLAFKYKPSKKVIAKEAKKTKDYTFIIIYSSAALILFLYVKFGAKINFNERKKLAHTESRALFQKDLNT